MLRIVTILSVAVVAATAYDFKDAYFNQYLLEDFQSLNSNLLSRQRRDAEEAPVEGSADKGHHCGTGGGFDWKKDYTCCQTLIPNPTYFGLIRDAKHECAMKLRANNSDAENFDPFNCAQMEKIKELIMCETECVGKSMGHMDAEGNIKLDVIYQSFKEQFPEAEESAHKQLISYVETCLGKIKDNDLKPEGKCSRMPMEMHHCMFRELIRGCPVESQIQSHVCDRMRENFGKDEIIPVGRHAFFEFMHHMKHHGAHKHGKE